MLQRTDFLVNFLQLIFNGRKIFVSHCGFKSHGGVQDVVLVLNVN